MFLQNLLRRFQADSGSRRDHLLGHHLAHLPVEPPFEAQIAIRQDSDQPLVSHHRQSRNSISLHDRERVTDLLFRMHRDRVRDHPALELLHRRDFRRLTLDRQIAMDKAEPTELCNHDRAARLGHRVHRARHQRDPQSNALAERGGNVAVRRQQIGELRQQEHVVKGESVAKLLVRHLISPIRRVSRRYSAIQRRSRH